MGKKQRLKAMRKVLEGETVLKQDNKKQKVIGLVIILLFCVLIQQVYILVINSMNHKSNNSKVSEVVVKDDDSGEDMKDEIVVNSAVLKTSRGDIKLKLFTSDAPKTVQNFIKLAQGNYYDNIKFHRVAADFVIQAGDPYTKGKEGVDFVYDASNNPRHLPIAGTGGPGYFFDDEINEHKIVVGTLAMANVGRPNSNGSQFFIVTHKAQPYLDGKHTVFGEVVEGMDVVRSIQRGDTILDVLFE